MPLPFRPYKHIIPDSFRPIKHQTYKDRLDESLGMRRGPERNFRQSMADRRDESIGASLGRYGEPGLPSVYPNLTGTLTVAPPVVPPIPPTYPPTTSVNFPQLGGGYSYSMDPTITTSTYGEPGAPYEGPITGPVVSTTGAGTGYDPDPNAAVAAAVGGGLPGEPGATTPVVDPVQEAIDQIVTPPVEVEEEVGGGTLPTDEDFSMGLPEGHPFFQSPEYLAWQEQGGIGTMDVVQASDGTWFGSGTTAGLYDKWLANQQNQTDPGTGVVDTGTGTVDTGEGPDPTPDIQALIDEWWAGLMAEQEAQQTAQDTARQTAIDQAAAMTGQYTLTGPSIGYNPYESGQYASSPYGTAGVPEMGGITTIPVPATYKAPGTT